MNLIFLYNKSNPDRSDILKERHRAPGRCVLNRCGPEKSMTEHDFCGKVCSVLHELLTIGCISPTSICMPLAAIALIPLTAGTLAILVRVSFVDKAGCYAQCS